ncbi:Acetate transporter GPR1/FUN34/SatP family [Trypanosoma melophagium]|uniref:Acetate transporter GPR1/FUN34/SatP family n=1 Tax=Trypanosoma melophagium TaxID=715481 RepID=UPI00351A183E|nr:Acetate transporter GPR1/FUN34/SatP family [Trypanosoma melophagium]
MENKGSNPEIHITHQHNGYAIRDVSLESGPGDCTQTLPVNEPTGNVAQVCGCTSADDFRNKLADPAALGLLAFGMTTLLFNISIADLCPINTTTAGMVLCYGGGTQVLVGIMEFIRGNTFGCTLTTTFGAFWLATACMWVLPRQTEQTPDEYLVGADTVFSGAFFLMWAVFTFVMCASALQQPLVIVLVIFTAALNFTLQCISFWSGSQTLKRVAGFEGMFCGLTAIYSGLALTVNESYKGEFLPLLQHNRGRITLWKKSK